MAKNMARLRAGVVMNIEWLPDRVVETDTLKEMGDIPAGIGDTWVNGKFYRDGKEVISVMEQMRIQNAEYAEALAIVGVTE